MEMRFAATVVGTLWVVCGLVVAFSPPVVHSDGDVWAPWVGWLVVAAGVAALAAALGGGRLDKGGRHSNGRTARAEGGVEWRLIFSAVFAVFVGGAMIWAGIEDDEAPVTSYGVAVLGVVVFLVPHIVDAIHDWQDR